MLNFRRLFGKAAPASELPAVPDAYLPNFENLEKTERASIYSSEPLLLSKARTKHSKRSLAAKLLLIVLTFALTVSFGRRIVDYAFPRHDAVLQSEDPAWEFGTAEPITIAAPPVLDSPVGAAKVDRQNWIVACSSEKDNTYECSNAIGRGGINAEWRSADVPGTDGHWISIDLNETRNVHSLAMTPSKKWKRQGGSVRKHFVEIATVPDEWETVSTGTWRESVGIKYATFEPQPARYVRLWITDSSQEKDFVAISNVDVYAVAGITAPIRGGGRWDITINFPVVPVTAFLNPKTHDLVVLASYRPNIYKAYEAYETYTATWYANNGTVVEELVEITEHDMFCPGTSLDEHGKVFVTGGSTPEAFSIYDSTTGSWSLPTDTTQERVKLQLRRGYHGQTFLPNGKTFLIGGEWSGGHKDKNGEVYDPVNRTWTLLDGVKASMIRMDPSQSCDPPTMRRPCFMDEWEQHHPWLFAWKDGSVFHAGPSKKMNWFFTTPPYGDTKDGGYRKDYKTGFADGNAVSGIAVMYDAVNGRILTGGGAPNYDYWHARGDRYEGAGHRKPATNNVFEMQLGEAGEIVEPRQVSSMKHKRIFANSVILPNGEVMVVGGQSLGEPFVDETWHQYPEIYSPLTETWREASPNSIPRVYHSWALLMPDATVLVGGGGLEVPDTDHYDAQIYEPGYLFTPDGSSAAVRPTIKTINAHIFSVGGHITVTTDMKIEDASLIRYSAATHALNNDLRRIKLDPVKVDNAVADADADEMTFTMKIPSDPGVALPGYWMLFVLTDNVPSVSETVQILF